MGRLPNDAERDPLLDWLKEPSTTADPDDELQATVDRNLTAGSRRVRRRSPGPEPDDDALVRAFLPPTRSASSDDWRTARSYAGDWRIAKLDVEAARNWLRAGALPKEAGLVDMLIQEGIGPDRATEAIEHPETGERITIIDVARRAFKEWDYNGTSLCEALDKAGVERDRLYSVDFMRYVRRSYL